MSVKQTGTLRQSSKQETFYALESLWPSSSRRPEMQAPGGTVVSVVGAGGKGGVGIETRLD